MELNPDNATDMQQFKRGQTAFFVEKQELGDELALSPISRGVSPNAAANRSFGAITQDTDEPEATLIHNIKEESIDGAIEEKNA